MPIYEYRCRTCNTTSSFFTRSIGQQVDTACSSCGGRDMQRAVSTFAHHHTTADIHAQSGPPPRNPSLDYYKDPRNIGRNVQETFRKFGMDVPESVQQSIQAAREGELPESLHT